MDLVIEKELNYSQFLGEIMDSNIDVMGMTSETGKHTIHLSEDSDKSKVQAIADKHIPKAKVSLKELYSNASTDADRIDMIAKLLNLK